MATAYTLSRDELDRLERGESVLVEAYGNTGELKIRPPCGSDGHEWGNYRIKSTPDDEHHLIRTCSICSKTETRSVEPSVLFDKEGCECP